MIDIVMTRGGIYGSISVGFLMGNGDGTFSAAPDTGYGWGGAGEFPAGMETYSLSVDRQKDLRAGVGIAPANYNIYVPPNKTEACTNDVYASLAEGRDAFHASRDALN